MRAIRPATRNFTPALWVGYVLVALLAITVGVLMAAQVKIGMGLTGGIIGATLLVVCMMDTVVGLCINLIFSFVAFHFSRWLFNDDLPVGSIDDALVLATLLGLFLRRVTLKDTLNTFIHTAVVTCFLIYLGYGVLELFNPFAHSVQGWVLGFRKLLGTYILLFTAYVAFKDRHQIDRFLRVVFWGCVVLGLYGCLQQAVGLFNWERDWVMSDELRFGLMFIGGEFRKFSMLSDPMAFGLLMAAAGLFFSILSTGEKGRTRWIMRLGVIPMFLGMAYSGTRTANFMVVIGLALYILLSFNKRSSRIFAAVSALVLVALIYVPYYSNNTLNRFRSTFQANEDQSYKVREMNRAYIQPYMWAHPIGGGLCTTGEHGLLYNPGHPLAGFPPDNGYLEKALETGWLGLGLICMLYFLVLRTGVRAYFACASPRDQLLAAGCTVAIFAFYAAYYSQVALGQISDIIIYYPFIAILLRLNEPGYKKTIDQ
jgi:putative inorganic carbon (hco3(-)) transporter